MTPPTLQLVLCSEDPALQGQFARLLERTTGLDCAIRIAGTVEEALAALKDQELELVVLDCRLGSFTALELMDFAHSQGCRAAFIVLVERAGQGRAALEARALDYLVRGRLTAPLLERSLRLGVEHLLRLQEQEGSRQHLETIYRLFPKAVFTVNADCQITSWNRKATRLTGYQDYEVVGRKCTLLIEDCNPATCALLTPTSGRTVQESVCTVRKKNGQKLLVKKSTIFLQDRQGRYTGEIGSFEDVSEFDRVTQERIQRERLAGVLQMAGAICHELNQPMQAVMGYSQLMQMYGREGGGPGADYLQKIIDQVERMAGIIAKLRKITRLETVKYVGDTEIVNLDKSIEDPADSSSAE